MYNNMRFPKHVATHNYTLLFNEILDDANSLQTNRRKYAYKNEEKKLFGCYIGSL